MMVIYHCHFGQPTGYARAAHDNLMALRKAGVDVVICPLDPDKSINHLEDRYNELLDVFDRECRHVANGLGDVHVYHETPGRLAKLGLDALPKPAVAFTTWETSRLPDEHVETLSYFDMVIVPSKFCQESLDQGGIESEVVPHALDFEFWNVGEPKPDGPFTFYTIGAWNERKNVGGLLKAYLTAFRRDDDVRLLIHSTDPDTFEAQRIISQSGVPRDDLPRLLITQDFLSQQQLRQIHHENHCFVSMTRCEGWGLGAFEALACGNPALMPDYGGQADFLPPGGERISTGSYVSDMSDMLTPCFPSDRIAIRDGQVVGIRNSPLGVGCDQSWAEPDIHSMARAMRHMFATRGSEVTPIRKKLGKLYNYDVVGERFASVLAQLQETPQ